MDALKRGPAGARRMDAQSILFRYKLYFRKVDKTSANELLLLTKTSFFTAFVQYVG